MRPVCCMCPRVCRVAHPDIRLDITGGATPDSDHRGGEEVMVDNPETLCALSLAVALGLGLDHAVAQHDSELGRR